MGFGPQIRDIVGLGGFKASVQLGVAHEESAAFSAFNFDGIFGLSMTKEPNHSTDIFSKFMEQNPAMRPSFAIYLSPKENELGSELSVGGVDDSKAQPGAPWMWSKVVPFPDIGFIEEQMRNLKDIYALYPPDQELGRQIESSLSQIGRSNFQR